MKSLSAIFFLNLIALSLNGFAHGEDKPGPHGGFIRMPSAFHIEVVKEKEGYRIYLLDIHWKNPSVRDSSVSASILIGQKKTELVCSKDINSYFCKSLHLQKGFLNIYAQREGQTGTVASYKLPLKFEQSQNEMSEHQNH